MMMNVIALWVLFSTLGAANVMFPDHAHVKTPAGQQHHLDAAKEATTESLRHVMEAAQKTGEGIRQKVSSASHIPRRTADAVQHFGLDVAQVVKDGSQSGLEKIGLARPEEPQSREEKSHSEIIKDEALHAYDRTRDAASDAVEAPGDKVRQAASAANEKLSNAAGLAYDTVSEKVYWVGDSASEIAQSAQGNFNAVERESSETAGSAYEHATDILKGSAEKTDDTSVDPSISSYRDNVKHTAENAAEMVRSRATEAASVLPNVGQGLAYRIEDLHERKSVTEFTNNAERPGFLGHIIEYLKGVKHAAGNYYESAKAKVIGSTPVVQSFKWKEEIMNKASQSLSEAGETARRTKDSAEDIARNNAGEIIDGAHRTKHDLEHQFPDTGAEKSPEFTDARDNFTQTTTDAAHTLKRRTLSRFQKLKRITGAYLLSSCRTAHLFVFSSVYGSSLWVTFLSGYILSRSIPRQQFGFVQSRIFPAYLRLAGSGQAVCLVLFLILHPWSKADRHERLQHLDLWAILLSALANIFFLEPRATKAMFQKLKTEKEEGRGQDGFTGSEDDDTKARMAKIDKKFSMFHGYSSTANLLSLIGMTWHLWHLSHRLVV